MAGQGLGRRDPSPSDPRAAGTQSPAAPDPSRDSTSNFYAASLVNLGLLGPLRKSRKLRPILVEMSDLPSRATVQRLALLAMGAVGVERCRWGCFVLRVWETG